MSVTANGEVTIVSGRGDAHLSRVRELDGVADQIEEHLRQALLVADADR